MAEEILIKYTLNQDLLPRKNDQAVIARLDLETSQDLQEQENAACDICLVLDCSGSMNEPFGGKQQGVTKRQGVMAAAKAIIPCLDPKDTVSIVFYASQAYPIATALPATQHDEIARQIDTLTRYNGGTNFEAGLKMTQHVLQSCRNPTRRLLFLTDGRDGESNPREVERLVRELTKSGAVLDCIGVGDDFNFAYMRTLSGPSNGFTELLEMPGQASELFKKLLSNAQQTAANNVFLNLSFPPGLRDLEVYQYFPEMRCYSSKDPGRDGTTRFDINVQSLSRKKRNIYVCKAHLDAPQEGNNRPFFEARLDYDLPAQGLRGQRATCTAFVNFSDQGGPPMRDTSVDELYYEAELSKLYQKFLEVKDADWQQGVVLLQEMSKRASSLGNREKLELYRQAMETLRRDHRLGNDALNRVGRTSSAATQQQLADLTPPGSQIEQLDY